MFWKISSLLLLLILSSCNPPNPAETGNELPAYEAVKSPYLIEVADLLKMVDRPFIKVIDFRKKEQYQQAHIPGALTIWRSAVEDASFPYPGMTAGTAQIESLFSELGISNEDTLIIYDNNGLVEAARLWWILQNYDFTNVKLLHGGMDEWKEKGGAISRKSPKIIMTTFKLTETPSMKYFASKEEVLNASQGEAILLDTRSYDEFSGKTKKEGASKGGRIPNSTHIDWSEAVNFHGNKKFRTLAQLRSIYGQLKTKEDDTIIVYCHSGVRSAHTTFVLTQLLNYQNVKNYDGSWTEWSYFDDLDYVLDSVTTLTN